jgi:membrane-associated phospholipid phosphatase
VATWYAAFHVGVLERADRSVLRGFADLRRPHTEPIANAIAHLCNPKPFVYFAAVPVLVALLRRRPRPAFAIGAILLGANVTTQLLKPLLAHPRASLLLGGSPATLASASWPSGHATAAMSLALSSVIAVPPRARPLVAALGAGFAVAVSYSFLTLGWHFPSDVLGGYLVAATWATLAIAVVFALEARRGRPVPAAAAGSSGAGAARVSVGEALVPPAAALLAALMLAGLLALARPHAVVAYAHAHTAFMVGAATIGAFALALATALALALRR